MDNSNRICVIGAGAIGGVVAAIVESVCASMDFCIFAGDLCPRSSAG